jgi:hypothetical protein
VFYSYNASGVVGYSVFTSEQILFILETRHAISFTTLAF